MTADLPLAWIGLLLVSTAWLVYLAAIPAEKVPRYPIVHVTVIAAGLVLGLDGIFITLAVGGPFPWIALPAVILSATLAGLFYYLLITANLPPGRLRVAPGGPILPFSLPGQDGRLVYSSQWMGQRVLLKFYRGTWCPFCTAELRRFERMQPTFSIYGVQVVAISANTVEQAASQKKRDQLSFPLLSDSRLEVIQMYGLVHRHGLELTTYTPFGIPLSIPRRIKQIALPTTLLVDEYGIVRWRDQTEDYRMRGNAMRIEAALKECFGEPPGEARAG